MSENASGKMCISLTFIKLIVFIFVVSLTLFFFVQYLKTSPQTSKAALDQACIYSTITTCEIECGKDNCVSCSDQTRPAAQYRCYKNPETISTPTPQYAPGSCFALKSLWYRKSFYPNCTNIKKEGFTFAEPEGLTESKQDYICCKAIEQSSQ